MSYRMIGLFTILLVGCGTGTTTTSEPEPVKDTDPVDHYVGVSPKLPEPTSDTYLPCQESSEVPTSYSRLTEHLCTDSNGLTYSKGYWDSNLNIGCHWNMAADLKVRCLPDNTQTRPVYADGACEEPIALVQEGAPPYIGLEHTEKGATWVNVYRAGKVWDSNDFYYMAQFEGEWDCFSTRMFFPGLILRYVGVEVNPILFVQK